MMIRRVLALVVALVAQQARVVALVGLKLLVYEAFSNKCMRP